MMHAAPMEDFERLEREFMEFREAMVDLIEVFTLTDDAETRQAAIRMCHEIVKERKAFRPDFELEWELGPDREIRFEEDDGA